MIEVNKITDSIQENPNFVPVNYKYVISLGSTCQPAIHLNRNNLRQASFPLDWVVTIPGALITLFETRFEKFLEKEYLLALKTASGDSEKIVNAFYHISFFHDFSIGGLTTELPSVKEKYARRINKMYCILESEGPVLFIRTKLWEYHARQFVSILATQFPKLKYTLLVINRETEEPNEWNTSNTIKINTKLAKNSNATDPTYDPLWQTIFSSFSYELEDIP